MNLGMNALRNARILNEGLDTFDIYEYLKANYAPDIIDQVEEAMGENAADYLKGIDTQQEADEFLESIGGRLAEDGEGEVRDFQPIHPHTEGPAGVPGPDGKQGVSLTGRPIKALKDRPTKDLKDRAWAGDLDHEIPLRDDEDAE
jgi:hypothetical protein|tara:strand:+ start:76 stop:510 length:435 start_codon:yes stop_codon:yes gene_type:complete